MQLMNEVTLINEPKMIGLWQFIHSVHIYLQSSIVLVFSTTLRHLLESIEMSKSIVLRNKVLEKKE